MKQRLQVVTPSRGGETDPLTLRRPDETHLSPAARYEYE